jgi:hypothetical protein
VVCSTHRPQHPRTGTGFDGPRYSSLLTVASGSSAHALRRWKTAADVGEHPQRRGISVCYRIPAAFSQYVACTSAHTSLSLLADSASFTATTAGPARPEFNLNKQLTGGHRYHRAPLHSLNHIPPCAMPCSSQTRPAPSLVGCARNASGGLARSSCPGRAAHDILGAQVAQLLDARCACCCTVPTGLAVFLLSLPLLVAAHVHIDAHRCNHGTAHKLAQSGAASHTARYHQPTVRAAGGRYCTPPRIRHSQRQLGAASHKHWCTKAALTCACHGGDAACAPLTPLPCGRVLPAGPVSSHGWLCACRRQEGCRQGEHGLGRAGEGGHQL